MSRNKNKPTGAARKKAVAKILAEGEERAAKIWQEASERLIRKEYRYRCDATQRFTVMTFGHEHVGVHFNLTATLRSVESARELHQLLGKAILQAEDEERRIERARAHKRRKPRKVGGDHG